MPGSTDERMYYLTYDKQPYGVSSLHLVQFCVQLDGQEEENAIFLSHRFFHLPRLAPRGTNGCCVPSSLVGPESLGFLADKMSPYVEYWKSRYAVPIKLLPKCGKVLIIWFFHKNNPYLDLLLNLIDNHTLKILTCLKFKKWSYFLIGQLCTLMVIVVILSEGFLFTVHTYYYNGITTHKSYHTHGITPVVFIRQ